MGLESVTASDVLGGILMKVRDVIARIEADGWYFVGQEGSHRQFKHSVKKGRVTITGKPGKQMPKGLLHSVLSQAGLKGE